MLKITLTPNRDFQLAPHALRYFILLMLGSYIIVKNNIRK